MSGSEAPVRRAPFSRRTAYAVGAALAIAGIGVAWILAPKGSETTDAAYLQADSSVVAPKVRGLVAEVLVSHNQTVKRGDPLVRIDPEEFEARVSSAAADVRLAEAGVASASAALAELDAEARLAAAGVHASEVLIKASDAQQARAEADRRRYETLAAAGAVALREADVTRAAAVSAQSDAEHSRAQLDVDHGRLAVVQARRSSLLAAQAQAQAALQRAQAALELATQDRDHALVRAPVDGVVADRQVEPGDYVQPGSRLLTIEPVQALYVTANFKETQVARMAPGQPARIRIDAFPGVVLTGRVDSLAPGTGSQFSMLPFEPGVGNFTRIVQRVPVRVKFDPGQSQTARLRPGLSTTVTVRLTPG